MTGKLVFFLLACFLAVSTGKVRYDNYKVFKVIPQTVEELKVLNLVRTIGFDLNFWNEPTKIDLPVLIMVAPESVSEFEKFMHENKITAEMVIPDVQKLISAEERRMAKAPKEDMEWTKYHTLDEINAWLTEAIKNTNFKVDVIEVGKSFEGRSISGLHITNKEDADNKLQGIILESGIHAREWIAPAASSYVINEILKDDNASSVWHQFQYIYIPTINPDGYDYTFRHDRMWRKSRRPFLGGLCVGADLNRNWDSHWMSAGASSNPCLEDYAGPEPFSETETKTISDFYSKLNETYKDVNFDIYISFHSFSQLLMYPWGYTDEPTEFTQAWDEIAGNATKALTAVYGTQYDYGNIHDTIYPASGSSIEYFYEKFNSFLTFTFELRDQGEYGFLLPSDQIIPTGEELKAALEYMLNNYLERTKAEEF